MKTSHYVVPIDFSPVTQHALTEACRFVQDEETTVIALHIVSKKSEKTAATAKMEDMIKALPKELQHLVEYRILVGDIFDDIGKAAEILAAKLIIMGTHGARGMQKIFGSNALKMVGSTSTPFIILQNETKLVPLKNIVMPFNFDKESIQIVNYAAYLAKKFNASIHLIGSHESDQWLKGKLFSNQSLISNMLNNHGIDYKIENFPSSKNFIKEVVQYAHDNNAELIAASFFSDALIQSMNPFIQGLIENEMQIPFLTVNAEDFGTALGPIAY